MSKKIDVILDLIKSNGIDTMKEIDLIKILSDLTYDELNIIMKKSISVFGVPNRIINLKKVIEIKINDKINEIKSKEYFINFMNELNNNNWINYIKTLSTEELNNIKKVVTCIFPDTTKDKIIFYIKEEIKHKEKNKDLKFN